MKIKNKLLNLGFTAVVCMSFFTGTSAHAVEQTLIFPIPQQIQVTAETFIPDENLSIIVPVNAGKNDLFLARYLVHELSDKYGIAVKIEPRTDIPKNRKVVLMGKFDNPLIKEYCKDNKLDITVKNPGPDIFFLQYFHNWSINLHLSTESS